MKKIYEDTSNPLSVYKFAVSDFFGTRLYVINYSKNKLLTLSRDGTVLSSVEDSALIRPTGVHVSETGQLLVWGHDSNTVVQIDGEVRVLDSEIDGIYHPKSVYYSARTGRLIVGLFDNILVIHTRKLQFKHDCYGIALCKGSLYVTSGTALHQYTLDGRTLKKIYEDTSDSLTVYKCAVSTDGSRLYVTNRSNHKLLTLSVDGTVLSSLEDPALLNPIGVHVSEAGQLLVCGEGSNNLVQVDGERGMVTLASEENGLHYPYSVYYSERTSRLIVAQNSKNILVIKTK
ncbi:uncharacterized protein LOC127872090 [Dreissena polymorpha]|uniref:uncharacterized protein LOC127872090 n=1 Tax=Dreissena polymorpha TaxID=45954 RepID=UPI0022652D59|nr:uncharacterized protein LOC127872090 [Dreissena polymorpha]